MDEITTDEVSIFDIANGYPAMMLIDSEDDFSYWGWTGDGSKGSPYTLEDESYTHYTGIGNFIEIRHTRSNFTIKNCTFNGHPNYSAIYTSNVTNGVISGCTFNVSYYTIHPSNSPGIVIEDNTMKDVSYGAFIYNSPHTNFSYNTVDAFSTRGVYSGSGSTNAIIHDNEIANGTNGYAVQVLGYGSNVTYNYIHSCDSTGVYANDGTHDYLNVSHNIICNITGAGLHFELSDHMRVEFNDIHRTG